MIRYHTTSFTILQWFFTFSEFSAFFCNFALKAAEDLMKTHTFIYISDREKDKTQAKVLAFASML